MLKVIVKIRPRNKREISAQIKEQWKISENLMQCPTETFECDHIFGPKSLNSDVFTEIAPMIKLCKNGMNATVFSYGEKASDEHPNYGDQLFPGKTYTMMGTDEDAGVKTLAIRELFYGNDPSSTRQFVIRVGYIEIFNETVYDLLNRRQKLVSGRSDLKLLNKEIIVKDDQTILKVLQMGYNAKTPTSNAETHCSHTIFQIIIESQEKQGTVRLSYLNLVDLDRSEGAYVKDETGSCVDKSLEYLGLAMKAHSNGEKFRNYGKSKLTRILKDSLSGNGTMAIIFNVSPTALNQTTCTLNFADEVKKVKTNVVYNRIDSDDSLMKLVQVDIARLKQLKAELEPLLMSDSGKLELEISEKESILLMERDMRPADNQLVEHKNIKVLKILPFSTGVRGTDKKYQIGETEEKCMDAQSRMQRKNNSIKWSEYYLERVGFEINATMRRYLKFGRNVIGRSYEDVDICVDSLECSRKHCSITVSDDSSVSITDLHSSNGTTINGTKNKGQTIELHEGDVISIVGGQYLTTLVGNFDFTVYRLCKLSTDIMQTYEIDDDVIEISDDDDGTSYYPMKMELEAPQPTLFIDVEMSPETVSCDVVQDPVQDVQTESLIDIKAMALPVMPNFLHDFTPDGKCDSNGVDFDLANYIFDNSTCDNLYENNVTPTPAAKDLSMSDLERLALELDELGKVQTENTQLMQQLDKVKCDYENDKKIYAETIREAQKVSAELQEKNAEHVKEIENLKLQLQLTENDRACLQEKNIRHIEELMAHFNGHKKPKLN